ncbi:MAG: DMT family transporter [Proteobacteria bacterium]|nr:DMT family transporter [Pseudomonadota bacterium]
MRAAHDRAAHALRHAVPLYVLAGLCLSSLDATAKYLVRDHSLLIVVWARYAGQMVVVTPFAWHRSGGSFWRTRSVGLQLLRSLFLLCATLGFWGGLRYLPLAEASSVTFLAPIIVVALSWPVLGERATRARRVASVVGFAGILVLLRPGSAVMHPAVVLLLAAAFSNALYQLLTRRLLGDSMHTTLFYSASVGTVALTLSLPWAIGGEHAGAGALAALLALGVFAGLGHWLMTRAYLQAPASLLSPFTYLQILWATAFGFLFFGQHPDAVSAAGMAIVIASGVLLAAWEHLRRHAH